MTGPLNVTDGSDFTISDVPSKLYLNSKGFLLTPQCIQLNDTSHWKTQKGDAIVNVNVLARHDFAYFSIKETLTKYLSINKNFFDIFNEIKKSLTDNFVNYKNG